MTHRDVELASQPRLWRGAADLAASSADTLPRRGQWLAVALAARDGVDPDHPRNLTRSIILTPA